MGTIIIQTVSGSTDPCLKYQPQPTSPQRPDTPTSPIFPHILPDLSVCYRGLGDYDPDISITIAQKYHQSHFQILMNQYLIDKIS